MNRALASLSLVAIAASIAIGACSSDPPAATPGVDAGPPAPSTCANGTKDGTETDVDCGGICPTKCAEAKPCKVGSDCVNGVCGVLAPTIDAGAEPGGETTVDAGTVDCSSAACTCLPPAGKDGVKNGDETDVDCGGTTCGKPCSTGLSCKGSGGSSCVSGFCVDGYCCNSFCNGTCEACNAPGDPGLCLPVAPGATGECPEMTACSTVGTCAKATTISCVSDSQCATNQCAITCAECQNDAACSNGGACIDGACFNKVADGNPCQADAGCVNGHCVDGVCCATACSGDCMGCHVDYTSKPTGTCAPIRAGSDPHGECSGPGAAATCSGAPADDKGASSCGEP